MISSFCAVLNPGGVFTTMKIRLRFPWGRYSILGNKSTDPMMARLLKQTTVAARVIQFLVASFTSHIIPF